MFTGISHLHVTVVVLFIVLFTIKVALLLLNKTATLELIRSKTKVVEMILGTLILFTGGFMLFSLPSAGYLIGKVAIVLIAIPLGIIGLKKSNKLLAVVAWLAFIYSYGIAETDSLKFKKDKYVLPESVAKVDIDSTGSAIIKENQEVALQNAEQIYESLCASCHGKDGKLGIGGAKDLSKTQLTLAERIQIIKEGKGLMPEFASQLTDQEIESVAKYIEKLKQ